MNGKGFIGAATLLPLFATLAGCLPQNAQTQGYQTTPLAGASSTCTPNAASSVIATGRSLLEITNSLMQTQQNLTSNTTTYAQRVRNAENAQKVGQGHAVLDNVETLAGGATTPCG